MTWHILGQEEVMICMAYFPVIFKASHLKELREYLIKRFKATDFDDFFLHQLFDNNSLCQFNIMCNFMWYFKNDEYTWRVHDLTPDWDVYLSCCEWIDTQTNGVHTCKISILELTYCF